MENKRRNLFQHAMAYGAIMGVLFSVNFLLSTMGKVGNILSYVAVGTIAYCTYYFTCLFRDRECEGALTYGKGLSYIVMLYFFAAIISATVKFVFFTWIKPDFLSDLLNQSLLILEEMNLPNMEQSLTTQTLETMLSPIVYVMQSLWMNVFTGLFVGLIVAAFTKKEKSLFEE